MTTERQPRVLPGAASLGPVRIVKEVRHAHGRRTKPYPVQRTYETLDGNVRIDWQRGGCRVSTKRHRKTSAGIEPYWHQEKKFFKNVAEAADWITQ